jgi:thiosulfate/3-mercaptopyruvate sulfurtransferase
MFDHLSHSQGMEAYAYPDAIVSTDDVVEIIGDTEHYRIIEADENPLLYAAGHIPGAVQVDWITNFLHPVMRDLITPTDFARLCSALGITPDMTVIFCGDQSNWWACHALWVFNYFGHTLSYNGRRPYEMVQRGQTHFMGSTDLSADRLPNTIVQRRNSRLS